MRMLSQGQGCGTQATEMKVLILSAIFSLWYNCSKNLDLTMSCQVSTIFWNTRGHGGLLPGFQQQESNIYCNRCPSCYLKITLEIKLHTLNVKAFPGPSVALLDRQSDVQLGILQDSFYWDITVSRGWVHFISCCKAALCDLSETHFELCHVPAHV